MAEGQKAGITGTPAFLFGFIESDNKVKATKKISGAFPYTNFKAAIDEMLSGKQ
jgi:predicted DsbA family dithiol-disulfide isomerase